MKLSNFLKQVQERARVSESKNVPRLRTTAKAVQSSVQSYIVESRAEQEQFNTPLFPTSERFHRYLDCIKQRDPLLYERIVGLH